MAYQASNNTYLTQANWFISPSTGFDGYDGTSATFTSGNTGPLKTWKELVRRWGTISPVLAQTTAITFVTSHTDNTDPVIFAPITKSNATVSISGTTATTVATVSLGSTVAKNRTAGANSLLQTNLGASGAVAQLLNNTTHSSRAWVYKSLGSNNFSITQPMAPSSVGGATHPAEVDTWANTDSVQLLTPVNVNIAYLAPTTVDNFFVPIQIYNLTVWDPISVGSSNLTLHTGGSGIKFIECNFQKFVEMDGHNPNNLFANCIFQGGATLSGFWTHNGGAFLAATGTYLLNAATTPTTSLYDGDFILGRATTSAGNLELGIVYLDATLTHTTGILQFATVFYSSNIIYGSSGSTINLQGHSHGFINSSATFTTVFTAPALVSPGIQLNNASTGTAYDSSADPGVLHPGRATTVTLLDATVTSGGFGGNAYNPGGASISNTIQ